jgi:hypothetical protein
MRFILLVLVSVVLVSAPDIVTASGGLVPCTGAPGDECQFCKLVDLVNNVISWIAGVMTVIAAIIFTVAGFKLVTSAGNTSAKQGAKNLMTNGIIGLIIILAAWLLLDFGLKALLVGGEVNLRSPDGSPVVEWGPWNVIKCQAQPESQQAGRLSATGDNATQLNVDQVAARVAAIADTGDVTTMSTAAGNAVGLTPEQQRIYRALIQQESSSCRNRVGPQTRYGRAYGCTQMLVGTAREMDRRTTSPRFNGLSDSQVAQILQDDNSYSITLGAMYFKEGLDRNNGDIDRTLARYNGGDKANESSTRCPGQLAWQCTLNGGYAQTRHYVDNIKAIAGVN